ncbi:MAG: DUF1223 domain-containing protein [Verrucomicrobia bacterium]|nr:MAG: DUF1223 domain-containing protein [Verrucomicrobiota bacterium]
MPAPIQTRAMVLLTLLGFGPTVDGADYTFESGPQKAHLLELFTSEGCSSCPPAESWFSKLKTEPGLWKEFVPLAFHVDYWNHLGWRDPFAVKEWTARQYQYAARWKIDSVYTPGFVVDGREWRDRRLPPAATSKPGSLRLSIANGKVLAEFHPIQANARDFDLHVARLGFDLTTKITAGENNGRNLRQDFVVLSLVNEKMSDGKADMPFAGGDTRAGAIAAWITAPEQIEPIQATGGWLR